MRLSVTVFDATQGSKRRSIKRGIAPFCCASGTARSRTLSLLRGGESEAKILKNGR